MNGAAKGAPRRLHVFRVFPGQFYGREAGTEDLAPHPFPPRLSAKPKCTTRLADVLVHELDQLIVHRFRVLRIAANGLRRAVAQMVAHELTPDRAQRFVHG